MKIAAKKTSQIVTHMLIAYGVAYLVTGSAVLSGVAVIIEPVVNVLLLPLHARIWADLQARAASSQARYLRLAAEKVSQSIFHMLIAFAVMYFATGSMAFGGLAAILEPICNVILLPIHDRFWDQPMVQGGQRISAA